MFEITTSEKFNEIKMLNLCRNDDFIEKFLFVRQKKIKLEKSIFESKRYHVCLLPKENFRAKKFSCLKKKFFESKIASSRKNIFVQRRPPRQKIIESLKIDIVEYEETGRVSILHFLGLDLSM